MSSVCVCYVRTYMRIRADVLNLPSTHIVQEASVPYSVQDGEAEDSAMERRADKLVADLLSSSSLTSTSVLQLVSDMSNCGSIAGFLAEGDSDVLPFTFSQESLPHSKGSADNSEQAQGRRMMMQTSTPVM